MSGRGCVLGAGRRASPSELRGCSAAIAGPLGCQTLSVDEAATLGAKGGPTAGGPTLTVLGAVSVQQGSGAAVAPRLDLGAETAPAQLSVVGAAHVACDKADAASGSLLVDRRLAVGDFDAGFVEFVDFLSFAVHICSIFVLFRGRLVWSVL